MRDVMDKYDPRLISMQAEIELLREDAFAYKRMYETERTERKRLDIEVERLRSESWVWKTKYESIAAQIKMTAVEAAKEIERLRAIIHTEREATNQAYARLAKIEAIAALRGEQCQTKEV